ncbi:hypothetical protein KGF57_003042 [Candida theae]|uniref:CID domain-containing protein n=1 Tax=Candida theae TaxID=1198502 RepID=A0AAD5FYG1_9ASCO|nr:uncharacterized protein KGF57_003042 [Candida theae]KAI5957775.1 hypothetical protein KGF57_003042 [Candida theae]
MSMERFDQLLKELPSLEAPGVSGSRIKELSNIATTDFDKEKESKIIAALYSSCKSAAPSHKLGTLYVVDSVARKLKDGAVASNETIDASAPDGTFASAVYKIGQLIDSLMDDALEYILDPVIINKIGKLVEIWEKNKTFDSEILNKIKEKHFGSTTPPGSPPRSSVEPIKPSSEPGDSNSILSALASLAKGDTDTSTTGSNPNSVTAAPSASIHTDGANSNDTASLLANLAAASSSSTTTTTTTTTTSQQGQHEQPGQTNDQQAIFNMLQQLQGGPTAPPSEPSVGTHALSGGIDDYGSGRRGGSRDQNNNYKRSRSRSPTRQVKSPAAASSVLALQQNIQNLKQQKAAAAAAGGNGYQTNSPPQQYQDNHSRNNGRHQQQFHKDPAFVPPTAMNTEMNLPGTPHYRPRNLGFDPSVPQGTIKVLSRTLFIGGVPRNMDERVLAQVLRPFAEIQSVILNSERKHAFVKVYSRKEAEQIITSFNKDQSLPLRTRWGVGFGPRECCNYQHGISIIPIERLTDADRNWVVNAQWGGTGGQPISSGMVIDEPDIEIGAGISSKAMSKKMPTNSARNGPKSNRPGEPDEEFVKTTLLPNQQVQMSHGSSPGFNTYHQSSVNPLQGLFGNSPTQQQQQPSFPQAQQFPSYPPPQGQAQQPVGNGFPSLPQMPQGAGMPTAAQLQMFMQMMQQQQQQQQQQPPR